MSSLARATSSSSSASTTAAKSGTRIPRMITTTIHTTTTTTSQTVVNLLDDDDNDAKPAAVQTTTRKSRRIAVLGRKKPPPLAAASAGVIELLSDERPLPVAAASAVVELLSDDDNDNDNHQSSWTTNQRPRVAATHAAAVAASAADSQAFKDVLLILPDAKPRHVRQLLRQHNNHVATVVVRLLQAGDGDVDAKPAAVVVAPPAGAVAPEIVTVRRERKAWSYDFMSASSFVATDEYLKQAHQLLINEFPCLSIDGARRILSSEKGGHRHYALAHDAIFKAIQGRTTDRTDQDLIEAQFNRVERVLAGHPLTAAQEKSLTELAPSGRNYVKKSRKRKQNDDPPPTVTDDILKEEINYVQEKRNEWMNMAKKHTERKENQARAQQMSTGVECLCCFDKCPIEDMCQCREEGHLFCIDCMANYAKAQVFGSGNLGVADQDTKEPAMDLLCFHPNCKSGFSRGMLLKALPRQTLEKYDELQCQIVLRAAEFKDLVSCPKCSFQFILENPNVKKVHCPVDDCQFDSCRGCGLAWHDADISCEEALRQEHSRQGRHKIEEAMTLAKVRNCPKCQQPFLKESGCNKISCSKCNTNSCYVCRKAISRETGYAHFCQQPHCQHQACGKCPLYTKDEEKQDLTNMRQAGLAAVANDTTVQKTVVDQLLQNEAKPKRRRQS